MTAVKSSGTHLIFRKCCELAAACIVGTSARHDHVCVLWTDVSLVPGRMYQALPLLSGESLGTRNLGRRLG